MTTAQSNALVLNRRRTCHHDQPPPGGEACPASTMPCETACRPRKNAAIRQSVFRYRSRFSRLPLLPFPRGRLYWPRGEIRRPGVVTVGRRSSPL